MMALLFIRRIFRKIKQVDTTTSQPIERSSDLNSKKRNGWHFADLHVARRTMERMPKLIREQHWDEAELLLAQARDILFDEPGPLVALAEIAEAQRNWIEAEERWNFVRQSFPEISYAHSAVARMQRMDSRFAQAAEILSDTIKRFPDDIGPAIDLGNLLSQLPLDLQNRYFETADEAISANLKRLGPNRFLLYAHAQIAKLKKDDKQYYERLYLAHSLAINDEALKNELESARRRFKNLRQL